MRSNLPLGVIAPYEWGSRSIPISGAPTEVFEVVDRHVMEAMRANGIVGCGVGAIEGGQVVYARGFGFEELPDRAFLPTTATRCGSLAKCLAGVCALLLFGQGELDLDEKVVPILAGCGIEISPVDERVRDITVRHLLDHTSGLPRAATYTSWRPERNLIESLNLDRKPNAIDVAKDALSTWGLDSTPGEKYQYANSNFVILARVIEARSGTAFGQFLTTKAMPLFGVSADEIFVSLDQTALGDPFRGRTEAAYYQTSDERYCSFLPEDKDMGQVFGEAYKGYSTECSDAAGGIAASASGLSKVVAALQSGECPLSPEAVDELVTPPKHYVGETGFDPHSSSYYSKGWVIRRSGGRAWLSHSGMTHHCGGMIGHKEGYQFVAVSNWNNTQAPFVDAILNQALSEACGKLR